MINSFENYLKQGKVKRKTPDSEEAKSLLRKAKLRLKYTVLKEINEETASFVLEDAYEAVRESAQALMSIKGFKPYSHEATISFIKAYYAREFWSSEIHDFDRFRQLRNDAVYKAVQISVQNAIDALRFSKIFINKVVRLLK